MKAKWIKTKIVVALALCLGLMTGCGGSDDELLEPSTNAQAQVLAQSIEGQDFVPGELLVRMKSNANKAQVRAAFQAQSADELEEIPGIKVKRIRVPAHAQERVRAALARNPNFEFVEPNFVAQAALVPNDTSYGSQWHLPKISAPAGWALTTGSADVPIAVIDSGVDPTHPDLAAKLLPGHSWINYNDDTRDLTGHGTSVAGAAAAITNNSRGVAGVAWANPIMPLGVSDSAGSASYSNIASAIIYAVDRGVKVINISLAGSSYSSTLEYAVNYAWNRGALVICSAANYNTSTLYYPAALKNAVAVAATDSADKKASYSNYGDWISITAPGSSIYTTLRGGGYGSKSGTSFSSPIAAGLAALIWSINPELTNAEVLDILQSSADDLGAAGFDPIFGHGRINALAALTLAQGTENPIDETPPVVSLTAPADTAIVAGTVTVSANATDDSGVSFVKFYVNNEVIGEVTSAPYQLLWNTDNELPGWHTLKAEAVDSAGNIGVSQEIMVYVEAPVVDEPVVDEPVVDEPVVDEPVVDAVAPFVTILSPLPGTSIVKHLQVDAVATDGAGVVRMEVYLNGALQTVRNSDTIYWRWNTNKAPSGAYVVNVKAYDAAGNVGQSSVTVYK